jgi:hypothetical protein
MSLIQIQVTNAVGIALKQTDGVVVKIRVIPKNVSAVRYETLDCYYESAVAHSLFHAGLVLECCWAILLMIHLQLVLEMVIEYLMASSSQPSEC